LLFAAKAIGEALRRAAVNFRDVAGCNGPINSRGDNFTRVSSGTCHQVLPAIRCHHCPAVLDNGSDRRDGDHQQRQSRA
jgi:hypothetical protein